MTLLLFLFSVLPLKIQFSRGGGETRITLNDLNPSHYRACSQFLTCRLSIARCIINLLVSLNYLWIMFVILESKLYLRKVWRYQRGNQKPIYIEGQTTQWSKEKGQTTQWSKEKGQTTQWSKEKGQTTQWSKEKGQKDKQLFTKHYTENYRPINTNHTKTGGKPWCSARKSSSCSTSGTCRGTLVTNPVIFHEWGNDQEVLATSGTYLWSFVTQMCRNGQPSHGGDRKTFEVMTST